MNNQTRNYADYPEVIRQLSSYVMPTVMAAQEEIDNLIADTELSSGVLRNLSGASRELSKSLKSLNLAVSACQMEVQSKKVIR